MPEKMNLRLRLCCLGVNECDFLCKFGTHPVNFSHIIQDMPRVKIYSEAEGISLPLGLLVGEIRMRPSVMPAIMT